jgi:flagellar biosynthesis/type III secretory pathway protein FliH
MSNGIYLTLEQYKDKDLPITITINGHTYHSQFALATTQTTWFEMGKQHGMELGADNTYSDMEMQWMHDQWYNEGYADGYKQGKQAGISKINLNTEPVEQTELSKEYDKGFTKGYEEGFEEGKSEGYEIGKKANGYSSDDIKKLHTDMNHIHHLWYDKGYNAGKDEGYKEGYTTGFDNGLDAATIANTTEVKPSPCNHGECIAGKEEEYEKGYYEGYEDGKNYIMQFI